MKSTVKPWHLVGLGALLMVLAALMIRGFYVEYKARERENSLNAALEQSNLVLGRVSSRLAEKESLIKLLEKNHKETIDKNGELIQEVVVLKAKLEAKGQGTIKWVPKYETKIVAEKCPTESPPVQEKTFFTFEDSRLKLAVDLIKEELEYHLSQKFRATVVRTVLPETGKSVFYVTVYEQNEKGEDIGQFSLEYLEALQVDQPKKTFRWWSPHLDVGLSIGLNNQAELHATGQLGLNIMSYGLTEDDNEIRVLRINLGICGKECGSVGITPVTYNIGKQLPLLSDLWCGPNIEYTFPEGNFGFGIMIGSTL